jgi:aminoacyl tRNA synthase complex-interacting multifunctional protein 1
VRKSADALAPAFDLVPLDFSNAPPVQRKALETKKKEKPAKSTENSASATPTRTAADSAAANKAESSESKPVKKKEKQDAAAAAEKDGKKQGANSAKATSTAAEDAGTPIPSMIDLRVGHIVEGTCAPRLLHRTDSQSSSQKAP